MKYLTLIIVLFFISCNSKSSKTEHRYMIEVTEYFEGGHGRHGSVYHDSKKTISHKKYSFHDNSKGYYDMYSCVYKDSILRANTGIDSVQIEIYER